MTRSQLCHWAVIGGDVHYVHIPPRRQDACHVPTSEGLSNVMGSRFRANVRP